MVAGQLVGQFVAGAGRGGADDLYRDIAVWALPGAALALPRPAPAGSAAGRRGAGCRTRRHRQPRPYAVAVDGRRTKIVSRASPSLWRHRRRGSLPRRPRPERCRHALRSGRPEHLGHRRQGAASDRSLHPRQRAQPHLCGSRRLQDDGRRLNRSHLDPRTGSSSSSTRRRASAG